MGNDEDKDCSYATQLRSFYCKSKMMMVALAAFAALLVIPVVRSTELTFELLQHDKQCFYEEVASGVQATLEYQVGYAIRRAVAGREKKKKKTAFFSDRRFFLF